MKNRGYRSPIQQKDSFFRYEDVEMALLCAKDNADIIYGIALDGLYASKSSGVSSKWLGELLASNEEHLTTAKLEGIIEALLEYNVLYSIKSF